jgi:alkylhydroperoxidase family enzyme
MRMDPTETQARSGAAVRSDPGKIEPHAGFDGLRLPPPVGLNRVLSRLPGEIAGPWTRFANALLTSGNLPPSLRELAILRTASRCRSDYIIGPHRVIGRHLGLTEDEETLALAPAQRFAEMGPSSTAEVVVAATDQMLESGDVDDRVRRLFELAVGRDLITELAVVVGQYVTVGLICKTARLEPEPDFID